MAGCSKGLSGWFVAARQRLALPKRERLKIAWRGASINRPIEFVFFDVFVRYDARKHGVHAFRAGESARSRIAGRLLPFLFLLYIANYLDSDEYRVRDAWDDRGLGLSGFCNRDREWNLSSSDILYYRFPGLFGGTLEREAASRDYLDYLGRIDGLTGLVRTPLELYGARFLLGAAEAGFFPGGDCLSFSLVC